MATLTQRGSVVHRCSNPMMILQQEGDRLASPRFNSVRRARCRKSGSEQKDFEAM